MNLLAAVLRPVCLVTGAVAGFAIPTLALQLYCNAFPSDVGPPDPRMQVVPWVFALTTMPAGACFGAYAARVLNKRLKQRK